MTPPWLPDEPWLPVTPPLTCGSASRNPHLLEAVLDQFHVETSLRYAPVGGLTRCNRYGQDVTLALGCPLPQVWLFGATWREMNANALQRWLYRVGPAHGWRVVGGIEAQHRAEAGFPAVATWLNPEAREAEEHVPTWANPRPEAPGHLAMVRPSRGNEGVWVAQAGAVCFGFGTVERAFGASRVRRVVYFTHD